MTPSSRWCIFSNINLFNMHTLTLITRIFNELSQIKYVHLVHMHIFTVAPTKANHLSIANRIYSMESFRCKIFIKLNFWFVPNFFFKIQSPQISQIRIGLSSNNNHIFTKKATGMISSWTGHLWVWLDFNFFNMNSFGIRIDPLFCSKKRIFQLKSESIIEASSLSLTSAKNIYSK